MIKADKKDELYEDLYEYGIERKYTVVVSYDIKDDKRRLKMAKFLLGFGLRVQRSVFECILNKNAYKKLVKLIPRYIGQHDLVRIYKLNDTCEVITWGDIGRLRELDEDFYII